MTKLTKQEILRELWRRGELSFMMHSVQKEMYQNFKDAQKNSTVVWLLSRQIGKSWLLGIIGVMQCLSKPHSIVKLLTDTKLHIRTVFEPIFREILEKCPDELRPDYHPSKFIYSFPNGSQIQLAGSDGGSAERLRGQKTDLVLIDEAAFCSDLEHSVESILVPTMTHTGGKVVMASTPPEDTDHDFITYIEKAEIAGNLTVKTIFDNPLLTKEQIDAIIARMGGVDSDRFRREYKCEIIKSATRSAIPEFTPELEAEITKELPIPSHYDCYVSMDLGGKDLTAILFGLYDFRNQIIYVQDELMYKPNQFKVDLVSKEILNKEAELWTSSLTNELKKPLIRVSDINYLITNEIYKHSNGELIFSIPKKDDKVAAIANLRVLLSSKKIIINPKCVNLLRHLRNVKWNPAKEYATFARSPDDGHYDFCDSILYMSRSIAFNKNPYPPGYNLVLSDMYIQNKDKFMNHSQTAETLQKIFGRKK